MKKINVIVNGLPGKMALAVAEAVINSEDMELQPVSLTGPEIALESVTIRNKLSGENMTIKLIRPEVQSSLLLGYIPDIIVDFTHPSAISDNVLFYTKVKLPFVLGTTGGDLKYITDKVYENGINAVVAPNMAKEIVAFQIMMSYLAKNFPGLFKDYDLQITESHQKNKADTSGTAKAMVSVFNQLGITFNVNQIDKKRTESDYESLGIPAEHWGGHGWHTYFLKKKDGSVAFSFTHNINGRQAYIDGTLDAIRYLYRKEYEPGVFGKVFSMFDVLQNK